MTPYLIVALGAISRYALDRAGSVAVGGQTVLGILLINVTGSFLPGVFVAASAAVSDGQD